MYNKEDRWQNCPVEAVGDDGNLVPKPETEQLAC
jgi:hypothetical protein